VERLKSQRAALAMASSGANVIAIWSLVNDINGHESFCKPVFPLET
jgi:hypothetical protein